MNIRTILKLVFSFCRRNILIIAAIIFWLLISFYIDRFVFKIFSESLDTMIQKEKNLLLFISIITFLLTIFLLTYLIRLIRAAYKKEFGSRIRLKMTLFFLIITMIPIIPFMRIGVKFIESSMNIWFSKNMGDALDYSESIIKTYYNEKKQLLSIRAEKLISAYRIDKNKNSFTVFLDNDIVNISQWSSDGQLVHQVGEKLFTTSAKANILNNSMLDSSFLENSENFFTISKDQNAYLILPLKITDAQQNTHGFVNISIKIVPELLKVMNEIDIALSQYNTLNIYKMFLARGFIILFIGILFPIILVVFSLSIILTNRFLEPVDNLFSGIKRISVGDYDFRIDERSDTDEFEVLSNSFNLMVGELEMSRTKILQGQRVATWQEIAKRLAHELRNPLTPIKLSSERIYKKYIEKSVDFDGVIRSGIDSIIKEVEHMDKLLNEFSSFAVMQETEKSYGGLVEIVKDVTGLFSATNSIRIDATPINEDYFCLRDPGQIKSVIINLVKNAVDAIETSKIGDRIELFIDKKIIGINNYAVIIVKDNGPGIIVDEDQDIFEPYYTTKRDGSGLGLAIAQRIITNHGGRIYYVSKKGSGATFFIELPIVKKDNDLE